MRPCLLILKWALPRFKWIVPASLGFQLSNVFAMTIISDSSSNAPSQSWDSHSWLKVAINCSHWFGSRAATPVVDVITCRGDATAGETAAGMSFGLFQLDLLLFFPIFLCRSSSQVERVWRVCVPLGKLSEVSEWWVMSDEDEKGEGERRLVRVFLFLVSQRFEWEEKGKGSEKDISAPFFTTTQNERSSFHVNQLPVTTASCSHSLLESPGDFVYHLNFSDPSSSSLE